MIFLTDGVTLNVFAEGDECFLMFALSCFECSAINRLTRFIPCKNALRKPYFWIGVCVKCMRVPYGELRGGF
jgi:hypothetical protein